MDILELIIVLLSVALVQILILRCSSQNVYDLVLENRLLQKTINELTETVDNQHNLMGNYQDKIKRYKQLVTEQQAAIHEYKIKNRKKAKQIEKLQQSQRNNKYQIQTLKNKRDKLKEQNLKLIVKEVESRRLTPSQDKFYSEVQQTIEKMNKEDVDPYLLDKRNAREL